MFVDGNEETKTTNQHKSSVERKKDRKKGTKLKIIEKSSAFDAFLVVSQMASHVSRLVLETMLLSILSDSTICFFFRFYNSSAHTSTNEIYIECCCLCRSLLFPKNPKKKGDEQMFVG